MKMVNRISNVQKWKKYKLWTVLWKCYGQIMLLLNIVFTLQESDKKDESERETSQSESETLPQGMYHSFLNRKTNTVAINCKLDL